MSLRAIKTLDRTPPKGRRVITRSRAVASKPNEFDPTSFLPVSDVVEAMVFSLDVVSVPMLNPCLTKMRMVEASFMCSDMGLKGSDDDSLGQLTILYCTAVSVKSP